MTGTVSQLPIILRTNVEGFGTSNATSGTEVRLRYGRVVFLSVRFKVVNATTIALEVPWVKVAEFPPTERYGNHALPSVIRFSHTGSFYSGLVSLKKNQTVWYLYQSATGELPANTVVDIFCVYETRA